MMMKDGVPAKCKVVAFDGNTHEGFVTVSKEQVAFVYAEVQQEGRNWKGSGLKAIVYSPSSVTIN